MAPPLRSIADRRRVVSIVTPAYNSAHYLHETVESALSQTFSDFELLIVDDGSTDETLTVAHRYAARDARVRVVATANGGPAAARNVGLRNAEGEFIALLDSDDLLEPEYLATQIGVFDANPHVDIVTSNVMNRGGGRTFDGKPFWPQTRGNQLITFRDIIEHEDAVCILSVFRRRVYETLGGFDTRFTGNEDYEFWLRAALAGFVILRTNKPLGVYRRHPGSMSSNEVRMIDGLVKVLRNIEASVAERPDDRDALHRQVDRLMRELPRAELRTSLQRGDTAAAARAVRTLAAQRGGWTLAACARLASRWPRSLVWAYRLRRRVHATVPDSGGGVIAHGDTAQGSRCG